MSNASIFSSPKPQFFDNSGNILNGGKIYFYSPGTVTYKDTYLDANQGANNTNPVVLDSAGRASIWLNGFYDVVCKNSSGTQLWSANDVSSQYYQTTSPIDQWDVQDDALTYIGATQFSVPGDLTNTYQTGRRIKATVSAGTVYGTITTSAYASTVTTVTVLADSGSLDAGLSEVALGIITATNTSIPFQIPIGGVIWWHKSLTGTPSLPWGWVECNGQTLSDAASPLNGQTIPNINGQARFIRGANTSGTTQANQNLEHTHTVTLASYFANQSLVVIKSTAGNGNLQLTANSADDYFLSANTTVENYAIANIANSGNSEARPINISMVAIMRVK